MGRIDTLLAAMTIEEKIGQLNMVASSLVVTGPGEVHDVHDGIRAGRIGALLNLWGQARLIPSSVQQLAVEESRLGVPLLLGLDVIHGHRTIYPVPLAEACALEPDLWEKTARAAAEEATRPCHTNRGAGPFDGYGSG
jgi:beta-glucosidase